VNNIKANGNKFADSILEWYSKYGRTSLPWQSNINAYRVWISEIMLQQTQVKTVIPYYERFMKRFPDVCSLSQANLDGVLALWSGLGYYQRGRNLYYSAKIITENYGGKLPNTVEELMTLPGIGRSTASAITSIVLNLPTPILDGNVKRVLTRFFMIEGYLGQSQVNKLLWQKAEELMPGTNCAKYTQAIMDIGSMLCTRTKPICNQCPLQSDCSAHKNNKTADFPYKKPKKPLPQKSCVFVILADAYNKVMLIKRPPKGIWGGLWCLPMIEPQCGINIELRKSFKLESNKHHTILKLTHKFSHFELAIKVISITNKSQNVLMSDSIKRRWVSIEDLPNLGIAKPVMTSLLTYFDKEVLV
jgi:A/G-specific adenine glycosylase